MTIHFKFSYGLKNYTTAWKKLGKTLTLHNDYTTATTTTSDKNK